MSDNEWTKKSEFDGQVGVNHPDFPRELLSEEEEKSIDDKGRRVIDGIVWSKAQTGIYLTLYGYKGHGWFPIETMLPNGTTVGMSAGMGKPMVQHMGWGCALELPSDLARDDGKKAYVTEWLVDTAKEILTEFHVTMDKSTRDDFARWLTEGADRAIRGTGL